MAWMDCDALGWVATMYRTWMGRVDACTHRWVVAAIDLTDSLGHRVQVHTSIDQHINRWRRESTDGRSQEVSLFFALDGDGEVLPSRDGDDDADAAGGGGLLHAVFPTKIRLPMGAHVHAPWLLSVDRQDVQSVSDNQWNQASFTIVGESLLYHLIGEPLSFDCCWRATGSPVAVRQSHWLERATGKS
jgi:hypothetical protein